MKDAVFDGNITLLLLYNARSAWLLWTCEWVEAAVHFVALPTNKLYSLLSKHLPESAWVAQRLRQLAWQAPKNPKP